MNDLAARAITGFAETLACLGRTGVGGAAEVRANGLGGARVPWAAEHERIGAAGAEAGAELVAPPHCVWSVEVPTGRSELAEIAMPCMGLVLDGFQAPSVESPSL